MGSGSWNRLTESVQISHFPSISLNCAAEALPLSERGYRQARTPSLGASSSFRSGHPHLHSD
jgi:hypothetical protein